MYNGRIRWCRRQNYKQIDLQQQNHTQMKLTCKTAKWNNTEDDVCNNRIKYNDIQQHHMAHKKIKVYDIPNMVGRFIFTGHSKSFCKTSNDNNDKGFDTLNTLKSEWCIDIGNIWSHHKLTWLFDYDIILAHREPNHSHDLQIISLLHNVFGIGSILSHSPKVYRK